MVIMVDRKTLIKVFFNSLFLQSSWSYERLQGLGFVAALAPALKKIYRNRDKRRIALRRHVETFNVHPYMASPVLGAVIRMEEEVQEGIRSPDDIIMFKKAVSGPFGAIGDRFFWGAARPLASIVGVGSIMVLGIYGVLVFLFIYNAFHLWMRWTCLWRGYSYGEDTIEHIGGLELPTWSGRIRYLMGGMLAVLAVGITAYMPLPGLGGIGDIPLLLFCVMTVSLAVAIPLLSILMRKGYSIQTLIYLIAGPIMLISFISGIVE